MRTIGLMILAMLLASKAVALDGFLIKTLDYSFQEKWNKTISSSVPIISTCHKVFKKQYFYLTAAAFDYATDSNNIANVEYSLTITKPDNSIYFSQQHLPLHNIKVSNKNYIQMSDAVLKICFEENDSFGEYKIEINIIDNVSNQSKKIVSNLSLEVLTNSNTSKFNSDNELSNWIAKYYERPEPEFALANYIYYAKSKLAEEEARFSTILSFFLEIFKSNKYLSTQIMTNYKTQDEKTKYFLLCLLYYSGLGTNEFYDSLEGTEKTVFDGIKNSHFPNVYSDIIEPTQLDMLWATFMAGGSYQPILKLIKTLDYAKYQGDLDRFISSDQTDEDRQKAINNAIYNSLVWSLSSNCIQHKLVKEYCEWAAEYENLSEVQRFELKKILDDLE